MTALVVYLQNTLARLRERQEGQTMAEYALILGGIAVVVIAGILILGPAIRNLFQLDRQLGHELPELVVHARVTAAASSGLAPGRGRRLRRSTGRDALRGRNRTGLEGNEDRADDVWSRHPRRSDRLRHHVARPQEGERR